jgi:hypothetical protein
MVLYLNLSLIVAMQRYSDLISSLVEDWEDTQAKE